MMICEYFQQESLVGRAKLARLIQFVKKKSSLISERVPRLRTACSCVKSPIVNSRRRREPAVKRIKKPATAVAQRRRVKFVGPLKFTSRGHRISDWHTSRRPRPPRGENAARVCIADDFLDDCAIARRMRPPRLRYRFRLRRLTRRFTLLASFAPFLFFFLFSRKERYAALCSGGRMCT